MPFYKSKEQSKLNWRTKQKIVDIQEGKMKENNLVSDVVEGAWHSKWLSKMLEGWSTAYHCNTSRRNDPPTLMKFFMHLHLSTPSSLPMPSNCEILYPIQNLYVHPDNIKKTSKRLHNECNIWWWCPPLITSPFQESQRLAWHMMSWCSYTWQANVQYVMFQVIVCSKVNIMYHFYITCHMLQPIASSTPVACHEDRWQRLGHEGHVLVSGARVFMLSECVHVFRREQGWAPPIARAGGGRFTLYLLQTLVHIMWGGFCTTLQPKVDPTCLGFYS